MNILCDDLILNILKFLSVKEKLLLREVSFFFRSLISKKYLTIYKLDNLYKKTCSIIKHPRNLIFYTSKNNIFFLKNNTYLSVHKYFSRYNNFYNSRCVVANCREKRLEYLYYCKKNDSFVQPDPYTFLIKKYIPYCDLCFKAFI